MKTTLKDKRILAEDTEQGKVYEYKDAMLMRCQGTSKPRFIDIHNGNLMILDYGYKVLPLKQTQPAIFEVE